ncbi:MAG: hypothetical protein Q9181_006671 [Wetmoreana brouardii]
MASTVTAPATTAPHLLRQNAASQVDSSVNENLRHAKDVTTIFNYYKDPEDGGPPAPAYIGKPETYERPTEPRKMIVHDVRGEEDRYTLDGTGFQVWRHVSKEKEFVDEEQIKREYYPEVETILKDAANTPRSSSSTGASQILIFDHTIRRPSPTDTANDPSQALRGPVHRVHIDQSYKAGPQRVEHHLPESAARLLRGRYQIINVWRPIKTVRKDPLAVADATSVAEEDLVPVQLIYPDRVGETFSVRPNERHRWYYLGNQTPEETLLIKCFDSVIDGRARRAPHSAFTLEGKEGEEERESIEVRALVLHPPEENGE